MTQDQGNTTNTEASLGGASVEVVDVNAVNTKGIRALYKKRTKIHPRRSSGFFRSLKWWIMRLTLGIYYITPWLRWDRGPGAPDQAVLIDFPGQRFYFFFIEIWPQEVYYIAGLLILAGVALFLVTSLFGRAWCGYACPQTVWTDMFLVVERLVEGDRAQRIRLDKAPMSLSKATKRVTKIALWLGISVATGGAWVFYFADAPTLAIQLVTFDAPQIAYLTIAILTFMTFFFGGIMREQVCIYMCPWPRIQAAMMDEESLTVTYHGSRGEPRAPHRKGDTWEDRGDCVDCKHCVVVCPTGIDIRNGQQLECITCALCIDACDSIMQKVGRPRGLIDYDSVANEIRKSEGLTSSIKWFRARTVLYTLMALTVCAVMLTALLSRSDMDISVLHDRNPLFTALSNGDIRNGYTIKILNKTRSPRTMLLTLEGFDKADLKVVGAASDDPDQPAYLTVKPDQQQTYRILVSVEANELTSDSTSIRFVLEDINSNSKVHQRSIYRGP